jgi:FkbM family methyltransferase
MASADEGVGRQANLVFDLGYHRGEDTGYYLAMGRRVVAVEANQELVELGRVRFAAEIAAGQLVLLHAAMVGAAQRQAQAELLFYPHPERSEWGSVDLRWVRRNAEAHGLPHGEPVRVPALSLEELVTHHGCPGFLKIDIEGADEAVLADLARLVVRPLTVSWETGKESLRAVLHQHRRLAALGYGRFRVVQQAYLEWAPPALGPKGGTWQFEPGCSGTLPELSGQPWRSRAWVDLHYRLLFEAYRLVGPRSWFRAAARHPLPWVGVVPRRIQRFAERHRLPLPGWFDSHALLTEPGG